MIYGIFAVVYGVLISIQASFCATLTEVYGNWFSTVVVHMSGFLALLPFFLTKWGRRTGKAPWYLYLGGVIGVANVVFGNYGIVKLGLTNCNVLMLLGEIIFAAVMDALGLLGMRKRKITGLKWAAICVMLLGTGTIAVLSGEAAVQFSIAAVCASLLRGVSIVIIRQLNGQLGVKSGTGYATFMNYATGLTTSLLIFAVLRFPMTAVFPVSTVPVWTYLCGTIGCISIFLCNLAVPRLSALTMSLVVFISETGTGMVFDLMGGKLSLPTVIGCGIVSIGMVMNLLAERRTGI